MVGNHLKGKLILHFILSRVKISLMKGCYRKTDMRKVKIESKNGIGYLATFEFS